MPPTPPALPPTGGGSELPVPLSSLAQPDDTEQMQSPAQGDTITFTVEATISRIDGETAYVKPSSINGNPLDESADETQNPDEAEGAGLRQEAEQMPV